MSIIDKIWISPKELELIFGISCSTQAKMRIYKKIPFSKLGRFVRYDQRKINELFEQHEISSIN